MLGISFDHFTSALTTTFTTYFLCAVQKLNIFALNLSVTKKTKNCSVRLLLV